MRRLSIERARRIALAAQGFGVPRPRSRIDVRHFRRVLQRLGVVQLDAVNVVARSHELVFFSRLGSYDRVALHRWSTGSGEVFEYWGHEASLLPVESHRWLRWRMRRPHPWERVRRMGEEHPEFVADVLRQVAERGPLTTAELDDPGRRRGPWWDRSRGRDALEWLFAAGAVTAFRTPTFARRYDLPERVLPAEALAPPDPDEEAAHRELLLRAARHRGIGTARDLADDYRLHVPTARRVLADLVRAGSLQTVAVDGWREPAYLDPAARHPRVVAGAALLGPFDPLLWERRRLERLFGFRYRVEIYVPAARRVHGYYVLPFLLDGALVARVDLKADRRAGRLLVRGAYGESGADRRRTAAALGAELELLAGWLDLGEVVVEDRGDLAGLLARR